MKKVISLSVLFIIILLGSIVKTQAQQVYRDCYYVRDYYGRIYRQCEVYRNYGQWRRDHNRNRRWHRNYYRKTNRPRIRVRINF